MLSAVAIPLCVRRRRRARHPSQRVASFDIGGRYSFTKTHETGRRKQNKYIFLSFSTAGISLLSSILFLSQSAVAYSIFPKSRPLLPLSQELGCSPTLSTLLKPLYNDGNSNSKNLIYFDPLGLANHDNFARLRESELKSGRVCMLALVHTILLPTALPRLTENIAEQEMMRIRQNSLDTTATDIIGGPASGTVSGETGFFLEKIIDLNQAILTKNGGITTNPLSLQDLAKVVITCLFLECWLVVMPKEEPPSMPGDYGWGWFGVRDKGRHERELVCELEHCRLAMVAFAVQLALELRTGLPWEEQWLQAMQQW